MINSLNTLAEKQAEKAEELPAFSGLKLLHIKRQIAELLQLIGGHGIFDEYTKHDISHIDKMLNILEWLIPNETQYIMSPTDWLMTVLAIYFHDLGMLVTKEEYKKRNDSGFPEYRDKILFGGSSGRDYKAKIKELTTDESERFLYQEFVRHKHAERVHNWILGTVTEHLGITHAVVSEVDKLLQPLGSLFRRDLALVCESHHLDDLNDFKKYKISQPYGGSEKETVNLQYCAILMRTADLLHMTDDRTPSVVFHSINPTDPISQQEWAKHKSVRNIRSKIGLNRENEPDVAAPRDTIEIFAYFTEKEGFFGLTSFLSYVKDQISKSCKWVNEANKYQGTHHKFPWRFINDDNVETEGFLPNTFEFTFDQAKILDLLTGHTLYNDTNIVLREILQNSLDAIRVQHLFDEQNNSSKEPGKIEVSWNSQQRILSVKDNGTGMTQNIVERHLLKVGSSRYQDEEFKRDYPNFSPISRFGIGLLSAFMIADEVEILTCHPDEDSARLLSLRSVHGKYLIQLLNKHTDDIVKQLVPHGTLIKLKIRESAEIEDILKNAERWICFPGSKVTVEIDNNPAVSVGFLSPKEAVTNLLLKCGISVEDNSELTDINKRKVQVKEQEIDGVTVAYAVQWSHFFKIWSFLDVRTLNIIDKQPDEKDIVLGTCVEGVRIEFSTPGFKRTGIVAIANAIGTTAPKTNVARSSFEGGNQELETMLQAIYSIFCNHVETELKELYEKRHFSLTWATQECKYLLSPLFNEPLNLTLLTNTMEKIPLLLVERNGQRNAVSPSEFINEGYFWTSDCQFFRFAEMLIREVSSKTSLTTLGNALYSEDFQSLNEPMLCGSNLRNFPEDSVFKNREVDSIIIHREQRRVDCRWVKKEELSRWYSFSDLELEKISSRTSSQEMILRELISLSRRTTNVSTLIGIKDINIEGAQDEIALIIFQKQYILPNTPLAKYLVSWIERKVKNYNNEILSILLPYLMVDLISSFIVDPPINSEKYINNFLERSRVLDYDREHRDYIKQSLMEQEFYKVISETTWKIFNPSAWERKELF
ncbi:MAG: ATP-binding protein [Nostoc sp. S4]|nr:ATP-binding protein [Nostoc sp. S4]